MNRDQIKSWLPLVGAKAAADQSRGGWVVSSCPFGVWYHDGGKSNPSAFAVKIEAGDSFCNCFSCAWHGTQGDAVTQLGFLSKANPGQSKLKLGEAMQMIVQAEEGMDLDLDSPDLEEVLFSKKPPHLFPEDWLSSFKPALALKWSRSYLQQRGVSPIIAEALDLRADSNQNRVCFPVRDWDQRLRGLHGRAVDPEDEPRWRMYNYNKSNNPGVWLGEHYVELDKPIVVVEGAFDLTSVARVCQNVVSPLFANPSYDKLRRMQDALTWVTMLDRGKGGDTGRARISKALPQHEVTHVLPTEGRKDPNEMTVAELTEALDGLVDMDGPEV